MRCQNTRWWLSTLGVTTICYEGVNPSVAVYNQQNRRCCCTNTLLPVLRRLSGCNPQDFQYFSLYHFGCRYKRKPHSLQNMTEVTSLWFLLLTGAVQAQRENRQSSYVCLSARKGREAFISSDISFEGATFGSIVTVVKFRQLCWPYCGIFLSRRRFQLG